MAYLLRAFDRFLPFWIKNMAKNTISLIRPSDTRTTQRDTSEGESPAITGRTTTDLRLRTSSKSHSKATTGSKVSNHVDHHNLALSHFDWFYEQLTRRTCSSCIAIRARGELAQRFVPCCSTWDTLTMWTIASGSTAISASPAARV